MTSVASEDYSGFQHFSFESISEQYEDLFIRSYEGIISKFADFSQMKKMGCLEIDEGGGVPYYTRKPSEVRFPRQWQHMSFRQRRENLIDKDSIYGKQMRQTLPLPGHRDAIIKEAADIGWKEERRYLRKMTGYPTSAHISGSAHSKKRVRPLHRRPTANTICQEYQYVHNGLRGKMVLNSKKFSHIFPEEARGSHDMKEQNSHYCEVLGKGTCAECIEQTNRKMAEEYQKDAFPQIDTTAASLVAPKLSKTLTKSFDRKDSRLQSKGLFDDGDSPIPYRMPSALREARGVTIYNDIMLDSMRQALARDRRITQNSLERKTTGLTRKMSTQLGSSQVQHRSRIHALFSFGGLFRGKPGEEEAFVPRR